MVVCNSWELCYCLGTYYKGLALRCYQLSLWVFIRFRLIRKTKHTKCYKYFWQTTLGNYEMWVSLKKIYYINDSFNFVDMMRKFVHILTSLMLFHSHVFLRINWIWNIDFKKNLVANKKLSTNGYVQFCYCWIVHWKMEKL